MKKEQNTLDRIEAIAIKTYTRWSQTIGSKKFKRKDFIINNKTS